MKAFGAGAYTGTVPIGGTGRSGFTPQDATMVVNSSVSLYDALRRAVPHDIVYVEDDKLIDITDWCGSTKSYWGPTFECSLVSNGGTIRNRRLLGFDAGRFNTQFVCYGLLSGVRLEGPDPEIGNTSMEWWTGVLLKGSGRVTECQVTGWPYGAIVTNGPSTRVDHNDIHHNRRTGMGYGVQFCAGYTLIEANRIDYSRHHITGDRGPSVDCLARFNIFGPECTNTLVDFHGDSDPGYSEYPRYAAGGVWEVCYNDILQATRSSVGVRGRPYVKGKVHHNWTHHRASNAAYAFRQDVPNPYVNMEVFENFYGPTPPPDILKRLMRVGLSYARN